jgi:hypothetical protein
MCSVLQCLRVPALITFCAATLAAQTPVGNPPSSFFRDQPYQRPENCLPCHQRQYNELRSAVKAGYRNVSPLFNGLELATNFLTGGLLRPVYADSTIVLPDGALLNTNMFTSPVLTETRQVQAGFCFSCHNAYVERMGDNPHTREVPPLDGLQADFRPGLIRPMRDYQLVDQNGNQILAAEIGGPPPPGALPSLGAAGVTCDLCHNLAGADLNRSFQHDGFANDSLQFNHTIEKVGPFPFPVAVKGNFHVASNDPNKIALLRSSALCNGCHDVRVPNTDLTSAEHNINPGGENVSYFRLENLSTEWQTGPYNSTGNPFGKVVRCQDCHMSLFPFAGNSSYQVDGWNITSPTPGIFPTDYAAVPGVSTDGGYPLQQRQVVTHYFTGVDVPLLSTSELRSRLGSDYPDVAAPGDDSHGVPNSLETRREALMRAALRINLDQTDKTVAPGGSFLVRVGAIALTGHRFPTGFSQERTAYISLSVTDDNGFLLYQSGYVVDKPHPQTGETAPDGNLDDEDLEHLHVVVDPGRHTDTYQPGPATNGHTNLVYESGPDDGPDARVYAGAPEGVVLLRNQLTHIFLPGEPIGRTDAAGNPIIARTAHFEETFSAGFANAVDNFRSLGPLRPTTFRYEIQLPTESELQTLGMTGLQGPLHVHAQVNYEHFPPLFLRFLAAATGPDGPAGHDLHLIDERRIDTFLRTIRDIASADCLVQLTP